ncbi:hypothetical protein I7I50_09562 [Histoplasma capsulatum G186AR]|uniref:Uncharacterized protein n=1 Tax=Ajellomyces capsulatus TaxID=5037 RepID=A0A8H8CZZ1_AJECA|nr:hypothetical protein I7I52_07083 [Histoplasma capsulatum]QSS74418.1 hypothetical protein I7I50_09562 [Histoplasma capsulatum G186AR]
MLIYLNFNYSVSLHRVQCIFRNHDVGVSNEYSTPYPTNLCPDRSIETQSRHTYEQFINPT